ncbi:MAG: FkbM family methyltransferase [Tardiphaga sp.]|nr:FkbM family methyltransferase [Tardiphaga sp.]
MIRPLGTAKFLLAWLNPWMPAFTAIAQPSQLRFKVSQRDVLGRHISKYGHHEPRLTAWIKAYLDRSPRGIVIDVGANIGWHALHAARCPAVEYVVAFEPDAFNAWLLDQSLTLNAIDNVIVQASAAGDRNGVARLHRYKSSNNGRHSLIQISKSNTRAVPVMTIDSVLDAMKLSDRDILLIKIDVEGYEPAAIAGATQALARTSVLVTEFSPKLSREGGLSVSDMVSHLTTSGFYPHELSADGHLIAIDAATLAKFEGQTDLIWLRRA